MNRLNVLKSRVKTEFDQSAIVALCVVSLTTFHFFLFHENSRTGRLLEGRCHRKRRSYVSLGKDEGKLELTIIYRFIVIAT